MNFTKNIKFNSLFIALAIFALSISVAEKVSAIAEVFTPEDTYELCTDGIDNDENGSTDFGDPSCVEFITVPEENLIPEDTYELCTDGIDNDENGSTDFGDPSCVEFITVPEENLIPEDTYELCTDGIDNDENGSTDMGEESCIPFATPEITTPTTTPTTTPSEETPTEEDDSSSRRSGGSRRVTSAPQGEVLGAFTGEESCATMYLTTYMRQGMANNVDEVKKLQTFLNEHMNAGLPITGFFGPLTHQAVMNFQIKYTKEVLTPWGITSPTGYVFKTTRALINNIKCAGSETTPVIN